METGPQGKYMFYSSSIWGNNFHIPFCLYHALHFAKIFPPAQVYVSSLKCVGDMHMSHVLIILFLIQLKKKKENACQSSVGHIFWKAQLNSYFHSFLVSRFICFSLHSVCLTLYMDSPSTPFIHKCGGG